MSLLAPFLALLDADRPPADRPVIAWLGLDAPVEIIEAGGFWPLRLRADAGAKQPGLEALGEGGGHPGMRAIAARLFDGSLEPLARVAIGSTPVTGVWIYNLLLSLGSDRPGAWPADLVDVARQDRPSARAHTQNSLAAYAQTLRATDAALASAIADRNALRCALRKVEALRWGPSPKLLGAQARQILDAADLLPARAALEMVETVVHATAKGAPLAETSGTGTPVIYSGAGGPVLDLYWALEAEGFRIVGDDQDFGSRAIGPDVEEGGDPIAALSDRYRRRSPAPAGWSSKARTDYLLALVAERQARAVVFELAPFDHPAAWDHPKQARALAEVGIDVILLPQDAWRDPKGAARSVSRLVQGGSHV